MRRRADASLEPPTRLSVSGVFGLASKFALCNIDLLTLYALNLGSRPSKPFSRALHLAVLLVELAAEQHSSAAFVIQRCREPLQVIIVSVQNRFTCLRKLKQSFCKLHNALSTADRNCLAWCQRIAFIIEIYVQAGHASLMRRFSKLPSLAEALGGQIFTGKSGCPDCPQQLFNVVIKPPGDVVRTTGSSEHRARDDHVGLTEFFQRQKAKVIGNVVKGLVTHQPVGRR